MLKNYETLELPSNSEMSPDVLVRLGDLFRGVCGGQVHDEEFTTLRTTPIGSGKLVARGRQRAG